MSIISIGLNLLLAGLLTAALALGWRLNRRLKALRDSHDGFAKAVAELNAAAARAEQGLADLRAATDEASDELGDRIEKGRALALRLERLLQQKPAVEREREREPDAGVEKRLGRLLAAARDAKGRPSVERAERAEAAWREEEPLELRDPLPARPRFRAVEEDDLFVDTPQRPALAAIAGGRR